MRIPFFLGLAMVAALPAGMTQPSVVLPDPSFATTLGGRNNNAPFSIDPARYQQLFDGADVGPVNLFRFLQLRPATGFGSPSRGGHMVDLELKLGVTPVLWSAATADFATNNPAPTTVRRRGWVQMPVLRQEQPGDWQVTIPFDQPWPWPANGHFCVEVVNWGNTNNNAAFTYPLDASGDPVLTRTSRIYTRGPTATTATITGINFGLTMRFSMAIDSREGHFANYGAPCLGTAGEMVNYPRQVPRIGSMLDFGVFNAPSTAAALFFLGTSDSLWAGVPLPLDLGPLGARGCSLNTSILMALSTQTSATGSATFPLPIPNEPSLLGRSVFQQWMAADIRANPFGMALSTGGRSVFGL